MKTAPPYILIGESPPVAVEREPEHWLDPTDPRAGTAAARLLRFSGLSSDDYLALFDRTYLMDRTSIRVGKGRGFRRTARVAMKADANALRGFMSGRSLVILGDRAAAAFTWRWKEPDGTWWSGTGGHPTGYFTWGVVTYDGEHGAHAVVIPSPAGTNRWWNDPENRYAARDFFLSLKDTLPAPGPEGQRASPRSSARRVKRAGSSSLRDAGT